MVIRCERCSTMYELDESLLAPTGSQVQCTKCQHVFTAIPPRSAGRTLAGMPPVPEAGSGPETASARSAPARPAPAPREPPSQRAARGGQPAVYRPPASGAPVRAPVLKRDTVGTFEARLRWSARWRWLGPVLAVGLLLVVAGAWLLLSRSSRPAPSDPREEALALIALDDGVSLDEAAQKLADVRGRGRKGDGAAGDRALALVLRAAVIAEERESLAARLATASEERERLRREAPPGAVDNDPGAAAVAGLEGEVRARDEQLRALSTAAADQLRAAQAEGAAAPEVIRAAASLHALRGEREQVEKLLRAGTEGGRRDPWLDLADGWLDARDLDRSVRERAIVKLGMLAAARPDLLRGRYLLARVEASLGRRAEARTTTEGILAVNRRHEGARRLREELTATPAPAAAAPAPTPAPAPAPAQAEQAAPSPAPAPDEQAAPAPRRRKRVPQPALGASPPPAPASGAAAPLGSPGEAAGPPGDAAPAPAAPGPSLPVAPPGERAPPAEAAPGTAPAAPRPARPSPEPPPETESQGG